MFIFHIKSELKSTKKKHNARETTRLISINYNATSESSFSLS
jgi:hypothetical protein